MESQGPPSYTETAGQQKPLQNEELLKVQESDRTGRSRSSSNASTGSMVSSTSLRSAESGGHSAYEEHHTASTGHAPQANIPPPSNIGLQHDPAQNCLVLTPQLLHIYILSLSNKDHLITLDDKKTVIYTSAAHQLSSAFSGSTPDVEVRRGNQQSPVVATAKLHRLSPSDISLLASKQTTTLASDSTFGIRYTTRHPASGEEYTWKSTHAGTSFFSHGNLKLEHPNGDLIARFTSSAYKSVSKAGKLEILQPLKDETLDWVVVCCLAMIEKERRRRKGRGAGAAGGAGGAGGSACG